MTSHNDRDKKAPGPDPNAFQSIDPEDDEVRVWGPIMVLPFISPESTGATVRELARESATASIGVVIINLRNQAIGGETGLASLEKILKTIDSWRAEAILTGLSDVNREDAERLEAKAVIARDELAKAIPVAFQIAEAQRHSV